MLWYQQNPEKKTERRQSLWQALKNFTIIILCFAESISVKKSLRLGS